jgi:hypothetical protein
MIKFRYILACGLAVAVTAHADIYKYVDERGHVTYSNKPIKGGQKVDLPDISTLPAPKLPPPSPPAASPDKGDSRRDELRKQIAEEEKALAAAKQAYQEGSENPEVWRKTIVGKDGKPVTIHGRNVAAYDEKMKKLQDEVDVHEKNLAKLKAELAELEAPSLKSEEKK